MARMKVREIIHTSIISALTIAAAFMWRDAVVATIEYFVPPADAVFYRVFAAVIGTIVVIIGIYLLLRTEDEAELILQEVKKLNKKLPK